jgi:putative transposase
VQFWAWTAPRLWVRLRELARIRRRFGYREERLPRRRCAGRKRALGLGRRLRSHRWSLDFLSNAFAAGRRFRILAIVDDLTRERLALVPTSLPGLRAAREPKAVIAERGRPAMCVAATARS